MSPNLQGSPTSNHFHFESDEANYSLKGVDYG